jgi:hypothetical protein
MTRCTLALCLALVSCASAPLAPTLVGIVTSDGHHAADLELRTDGRWTWTTSAFDGVTKHGRLPSASLARFRALMEGMWHDILVTCDHQPGAESAPAEREPGRTHAVVMLEILDETSGQSYVLRGDSCALDGVTSRLAGCFNALDQADDVDVACGPSR